jgi:hypothetical protein
MATAHLTWTAGGGVQQEVWYKKASDSSFTLFQSVAGSVGSIDISGLDSNVVYEFKIINKCNFGLEEESNLAPQVLLTCPSVTVDRGALSLTVNFLHVGGDIDSYLLEMHVYPAPNLVAQTTITPPFNTPISYEFDDLDADTEYAVKVIPKIGSSYTNNTCSSLAETLGCPDGYTLAPDGSYCYLLEEVPADAPPGGTPEDTVASTHAWYSSRGSYIFDPGFNVNGTGTFTQIPTSNGFWVNGLGDGGSFSDLVQGPMNRCGLWVSSLLDNQDIGFSVCVDLAATSLYYIGMGADNSCRIVIDGNVIVDQDVAALQAVYPPGDARVSFQIWFIYPVTLSAGPHIIELIGHNDDGPGAMGAEIYHNTPAELMAATGYGDLDLIFSSKDYIGQPVQLGNNNLGYTCPGGYSLAACADPVVCRRIITTLPE